MIISDVLYPIYYVLVNILNIEWPKDGQYPWQTYTFLIEKNIERKKAKRKALILYYKIHKIIPGFQLNSENFNNFFKF